MQTDSHFTLKRPAQKIEKHRLGHRSPGRVAKIVWPLRFLYRSARIWSSNRRFRNWHGRNPTKKFRDFYAEIEDPRFLQGRRHPTLGSNLIGRTFGRSGLSGLHVLKERGLRPDDVCVDYGCGTLRVGIHLINYLKPGNYWGFDAENLLREGAKLIGEHLIAEKAPHLRVISPEAIAEVARQKPRLLYSRGVLIHVHPTDLAEYFSNMLSIIDVGGRGYITGKWSDGDTLQFGGKSWAHSTRALKKTASDFGGELNFLKTNDFWLPDFGRAIKHGRLEITKLA